MLKIGKISYLIIGIIGVAFGSYYLFVNNMAPYHYAFMQMDKSQIDAFNPRVLELMIALKQIAGACFIGVGLASFFSALIIDKIGEKASLLNIGLFLMLLIANGKVLLVSYYVAHQIENGPKPPWWLSAVVVVFLISAFITTYIGVKRNN